MQNREKPIAEVGPGPERGAALVGAHQGVMDEIFGLGLVAGERTRVAAHRRQLRDHIIAAVRWPCAVHDQYREPTPHFIRCSRRRGGNSRLALLGAIAWATGRAGSTLRTWISMATSLASWSEL